MRNLTATICLTIAVLLGSVGVSESTDRGVGLNEPDPPTVLEQWNRIAEEGYAHAQYYLGRRYMVGYGVPQDNKAAVTWLKRAAEQGHAKAQEFLGIIYAEGEIVPQDHKAAVDWFRLAADQGYAKAQFDLGVMYDNGQGVPQDYKTAVKWYRLAAEQGGMPLPRPI